MTTTWNEFAYFDTKTGQHVPDNRFGSDRVKLMLRPVGRWRLATPEEQTEYIRELLEPEDDDDY